MRLNLRDIIEVPGGSVPFSCELSTEGLDFPSIREYLTKPYAEGRVWNEAGILRLEGLLTAELLCVCDRCGEEFESTKETELDAVIVEDNTGDDPELEAFRNYRIHIHSTVDELMKTYDTLNHPGALKELVTDKTREINYSADYASTPENVYRNWIWLGAFALFFALLATISLELIDRDKR